VFKSKTGFEVIKIITLTKNVNVHDKSGDLKIKKN